MNVLTIMLVTDVLLMITSTVLYMYVGSVHVCRCGDVLMTCVGDYCAGVLIIMLVTVDDMRW